MIKKRLNILLLITEFLVVGGLIYWFLGFFLNIDWIKLFLAIIISLIIGIIILKKGKSQK